MAVSRKDYVYIGPTTHTRLDLRATDEAAKLNDLRDDLFYAAVRQRVLKRALEVVGEEVDMLQGAVKNRANDLSVAVSENHRLPRLPAELITSIISLVPDNRTEEWSEYHFPIDGWLPHMCIDPSLPLTISLSLDARNLGTVVQAVQQLTPVLWPHSINFCVKILAPDLPDNTPALHHLLEFPDRWKELIIDADDNVELVQHILLNVSACLAHIDTFRLFLDGDGPCTTLADSNLIIDTQGQHLTGHPKVVDLNWQALYPFLDLGLHHSVTCLKLRCYSPDNIDCLFDSLRLLPEFQCLEELNIHVDTDKTASEEFCAPIGMVSLRKLILLGHEDPIDALIRMFEGSSISHVALDLLSFTSADLVYTLDKVFHYLRQLDLNRWIWVRSLQRISFAIITPLIARKTAWTSCMH